MIDDVVSAIGLPSFFHSNVNPVKFAPVTLTVIGEPSQIVGLEPVTEPAMVTFGLALTTIVCCA